MPVSRSSSRLRPAIARSISRPRNSRSSSIDAYHYSGTPSNLVIPDGQVTEETVELLQELVHPLHESEETLTGTEEPESDPEDVHNFQKLAEERSKLPWHKRPSPWWFLISVGASAFVISMCIAPRIELYTQLVCNARRANHTGGGDAEESLLSQFAGDNERQRPCAADPEVSASVAKLTMIYTLCMGVLGCLTTGWWTSLSDRAGRIRVLGLGIFGLLYADLNFVTVAKIYHRLPGTYWWFVLGALVEGLFGSYSTINATMHAYVADTVEPHGRARIFSLFYGLLFAGFAFGPTVGGLVVRFTGTPLSVFYIAMGVHTLYALMVWFVIPESLTRAQRNESRRQYHESIEKGRREAIDSPILYRFKRIFSFLSPLSVLWATVEDSNPLKPQKSQRGNWGLLLMALSSGCSLLLMGSYSYKFQYTSAVFGWSSEEIGYWLSIVGFIRAGFLAVLLPLIIKLFKPRGPAVQLPTTPNEPLQPATETTPLRQGQQTRTTYAPPSSQQSIAFDLTLVRVSIVIEFLSMIAIPFTSSPLIFTAFSILGSFGSGHAPAAQSVSLALYAQRGGVESGKLLGALGVLQIVSSQVLGPAIFGLVFVKTIATMPTAIFFLSSAVIALSFIFSLCVRLPKPVQDAEEASTGNVGHQQDETLVDDSVPVVVVDAPSPKVASTST
ncbi:MFS general substrate transporter [Cristinia sonorae]|uniref:MFS general substrate transporter n=1 Tax=Cristinia sonorae TaxID=1940300 RepID=A0A8K0XU97_9AGAR|nr:MFS general substrate transporter [Cristinia sonorae]